MLRYRVSFTFEGSTNAGAATVAVLSNNSQGHYMSIVGRTGLRNAASPTSEYIT